MQNLVDRSGIGLEVPDQLLIMTALLERPKPNLLVQLHRLGLCWNDAAGPEVDQACIIILIQVKDLRS